MIQQKVPILFNRPLSRGAFAVGFETREIAQVAVPGQFLMIRAAGPRPYLLSRPFSIGSVRYPVIEVYYQVSGRMTTALSGSGKGALLEIFGPLGKGFTLDVQAEQAWLVGGGIGAAPFPFLAIELLKSKVSRHRLAVYLGFRSKDDVILDGFFRDLGLKVQLCTDDGSDGRRGLVTQCVAEDLRRTDARTALYGCGPPAMLERLCAIACERDLPCEVSVEERMACGVGACLVCACKVKRNGGFAYKMVCKDGPVFSARELLFEGGDAMPAKLRCSGGEDESVG